MRPLFLFVALVLCGSCASEFVEGFDVCVVGLELPVEAVDVGDVVSMGGGPFSEPFDTRVRVGGVDAVVVDVLRDGCTPCDSCRADADCTSCEVCESCDALCSTCEQTVLFTVPPVPAGLQPVLLFNRHGGSATVYLDILGPEDTDTDADTDTDRETDTDTDRETDTDTDRETDTDTDRETDTDAETDSDSDSDTDPGASDTDTDTDTDTGPGDTDTDTDSPPDTDTDTDTD